ncbi:hypothetical protein [Argonema galeatum]|uniref:hypothetical protein n=1 Tax=Argonema galeatum TaxID=2942762 RepID=UPI0020124220|nr:hypothetical protein [Argonema galeatum]MCL1469033.1 hypothetical protein [Argonema galeatum A003/A1]
MSALQYQCSDRELDYARTSSSDRLTKSAIASHNRLPSDAMLVLRERSAHQKKERSPTEI